jgi:hypothetical protein
MMRDFADKLKNNLDKRHLMAKMNLKKLENVLTMQLDDIDKNSKLLQELQDINDKFNKEELVSKIDKFKQKQESK